MSAARISKDAAPRLDALLRFRPDIEACYERERGQKRIKGLTRSILVGVLIYNVYNLTSIILLPDILALSVALRLLLITPSSLALIWLIRHLSPVRREQVITIGMINAMAMPMVFFAWSQAPLSAYTFGELSLTLVFGNMVLLLRFRHAALFTLTALACAIAAVTAKPGLQPELTLAFVVQYASACLFTLYGNWHAEVARCRSYLAEFDARQETSEANLWRKRFEDLSLTDALTGLPNRRALERRLDVWFTETQPVAVLMVDVDHFKPYNDRLGHPAGDDCLRRIAACLAEVAAGAGAFAARFGGEEFAVVLHNGSELDGARLALSIVDGIRQLDIAHPGRPDGTPLVTVSIGVARVHSARGSAPASVFEAADSALYLAKKRGRNRWVSHGEEVQARASSTKS
jgi:diguanylate cyclase (GGDEF)-like protein